jgi:hypothetical protein
MKSLAVAILALTLWGVCAAPNSARAYGSRTVTFRLQVSGPPARGATYWVAYGPLDGKFGIVRLTFAGSHMYKATRDLPAHGRAIFAYLSGYGSVWTRLGWVPGPPVVTIRRFGPTLAWQLPTTVSWVPPIG